MFQKNNPTRNQQVEMISLDEVVPEHHLVRKIDKHIDFTFIYDLVRDKYCPDNGRPGIDPVVLMKLVILQYMFGIKSMRQTIKEVEVNVAYRWFLGLGFNDPVPHFTTFGKNYERRFKDTDPTCSSWMPATKIPPSPTDCFPTPRSRSFPTPGRNENPREKTPIAKPTLSMTNTMTATYARKTRFFRIPPPIGKATKNTRALRNTAGRVRSASAVHTVKITKKS
jgi:transposase